MKKTLPPILFIFLICVTMPNLAASSTIDLPDSIVDKSAQLDVLYDGTHRAEGPAVAPDGTIYYSEQERECLMKLVPGSSTPEVVKKVPKINGTVFGNDTCLRMCTDKNIRRYCAARGIINVESSDSGKLQPDHLNDLTLTPDEGLFFTCPRWDNWPVGAGEIFYLSPQGVLKEVARGLRAPNGIEYDFIRKRLYVSLSLADKVVYYSVNHSYSLEGDPVCVIDSIDEPDGLELDAHGNIYAVSFNEKTIHVANAAGEPLGIITLDAHNVTNCTFGWGKSSTLYISGTNRIFRLDLKIPGMKGILQSQGSH